MPSGGLVVRPAVMDDNETIAATHAASFAASDHGHHGEADLVLALIEQGDAVVSLLAEQDGEACGHVLFSRMAAEADGSPIAAVALAPLAVKTACRRRGVGATLVRAGHAALVERDVALSFVLGDPAYYRRFGYDAATAAPYDSPFAGDHFMALRLSDSAPSPRHGVARHAAAFTRLDAL